MFQHMNHHKSFISLKRTVCKTCEAAHVFSSESKSVWACRKLRKPCSEFFKSGGELFWFPESKAASRRFACSLKEITVLQQYILTPAGHVNGFSMAASNARRSGKQRFNGRILSRVSRNVVEFSGFIKLYNIFAVLSSLYGEKNV